MNKKLSDLLHRDWLLSLVSSLLCIVAGLLIGYIVLLIINPAGAWQAIVTILKNFFVYPNAAVRGKYLGNTLVKTAPLLMCSLSVLFAYKVGLFNIGAAGQYVAGAGTALYLALALHCPWYICLIGALLAGALLGAISGFLRAYANVNEVISCIMLNWIALYVVNIVLTGVKEPTSPYTVAISSTNTSALLPQLPEFMMQWFNGNQYVTIAIPLAIVLAIVVKIILDRTKLGYELKATGLNRHAARYCGMKEKNNTVLTMGISGALAGIGAAMLYLTGFEQWSTTQTSLPAMGFNGIASGFLGGLNPIGSIFSSYFIQHITYGGSYVDKTLYSAQISDLIAAIIIYMCGFVLFFRSVINSRREARATRQREAAAAAAAAEQPAVDTAEAAAVEAVEAVEAESGKGGAEE